jgi:hypothetical protein
MGRAEKKLVSCCILEVLPWSSLWCYVVTTAQVTATESKSEKTRDVRDEPIVAMDPITILDELSGHCDFFLSRASLNE